MSPTGSSVPDALAAHAAVIRPATDRDGPGLAVLISAIFADYENCPFVPAEFPELAAPASHFTGKGGALWVVTVPDGSVVGSLGILPTWRADTFELFKVYLDRRWRGTGLAQALLDSAIALARERAGRRLVLWSDTRFIEGHRFYGRQGFRRLPGIRALHDEALSLEFPFVRDLGQKSLP